MSWRLIAFVLALFISQTADAKVYALTVGIDQYKHIPNLDGAVNDSNDIARTLREVQGAHVVQLLDEQATKQNFLSAWKDLTDKAGPGDYLILHVAGHGAVQSAVFPDAGEAHDNMYLLSGFAMKGEATRERVLDNEFSFLFELEAEATILFVVDTCFSGTLARSPEFGPDLTVRRLPSVLKFEEDHLHEDLIALGPPPKEPTHANLFEIYAGSPGKTIPELKINNEMRGALSYSVARAFQGQADRSGDQAISEKEMRRFIRRKVREHANGLQHPETKAARDLTLAFPTSAEEHGLPTTKNLSLFLRVSEDVEYSQKELLEIFDIEGIQLSKDLVTADLTLEITRKRYRFFNNTRDLIFSRSFNDDCLSTEDGECDQAILKSLEEEFLPVLSKEIFLRHLAERPLSEDIDVWTREATAKFFRGERIGLLLKTETSERVFLFALDKFGKITVLADRPLSVTASEPKFLGESTAVPPFGVDHVLAVTGQLGLDDFASWLKRNDRRALADPSKNRSNHQTLGGELLAKLSDGQLSVGTLPIFTAAGQD